MTKNTQFWLAWTFLALTMFAGWWKTRRIRPVNVRRHTSKPLLGVYLSWFNRNSQMVVKGTRT